MPDKMAEELLDYDKKILAFLKLENSRDSEKRLFGLLGVDHFELIRLLVKNKATVFYGVRLQ